MNTGPIEKPVTIADTNMFPFDKLYIKMEIKIKTRGKTIRRMKG
jgi:hypothetical protein